MTLQLPKENCCINIKGKSEVYQCEPQTRCAMQYQYCTNYIGDIGKIPKNTNYIGAEKHPILHVIEVFIKTGCCRSRLIFPE